MHRWGVRGARYIDLFKLPLIYPPNSIWNIITIVEHSHAAAPAIPPLFTTHSSHHPRCGRGAGQSFQEKGLYCQVPAGGKRHKFLGEELSTRVLPEDCLALAQDHPTLILYLLFITPPSKHPFPTLTLQLRHFQLSSRR